MPENNNRYFDELPTDLRQLIVEHAAAIQIQERAFKFFYQKYGPTWKREIQNRIVRELDYLAYLDGVADPWHDYYGETPLTP